MREMQGLRCPEDWRYAMAKVLKENKAAKILVLGERNCGKSSFCQLFAREILASQQPVSYLDADIGQKDIGPPGTISLGFMDPNQNGNHHFQLIGMYFVGSLNPAGHFLPMIVGLKRLSDLVKTQYTLINTAGFIQGSGKVLVSYQIEIIRPDVIIAIESNHELEPILDEYRHLNLIRIKPANEACAKSYRLRVDSRKSALSDYFWKSTKIALALEDVIIQRKNRATTQAEMINRYCGLVDSQGNCIGVGAIQSITDQLIIVLTPITKEWIRVIQLGDLWVSTDSQLSNTVESS